MRLWNGLMASHCCFIFCRTPCDTPEAFQPMEECHDRGGVAISEPTSIHLSIALYPTIASYRLPGAHVSFEDYLLTGRVDRSQLWTCFAQRTASAVWLVLNLCVCVFIYLFIEKPNADCKEVLTFDSTPFVRWSTFRACAWITWSGSERTEQGSPVDPSDWLVCVRVCVCVCVCVFVFSLFVFCFAIQSIG